VPHGGYFMHYYALPLMLNGCFLGLLPRNLVDTSEKPQVFVKNNIDSSHLLKLLANFSTATFS